MVEAEKATDALTPTNGSGVTCVCTVDQFIAEALMVALAMIVGRELRHGAPAVALARRVR